MLLEWLDIFFSYLSVSFCSLSCFHLDPVLSRWVCGSRLGCKSRGLFFFLMDAVCLCNTRLPFVLVTDKITRENHGGRGERLRGDKDLQENVWIPAMQEEEMCSLCTFFACVEKSEMRCRWNGYEPFDESDVQFRLDSSLQSKAAFVSVLAWLCDLLYSQCVWSESEVERWWTVQ